MKLSGCGWTHSGGGQVAAQGDDATNSCSAIAFKQGSDAEVSWWVTDPYVGTGLEAAVAELVPRWLREDWPFRRPVVIGEDLTWSDWAALPDRPGD